MIKPSRFITRLTIRLELYINFVVVPMTQYFAISTRKRSPEEAAVLLAGSLFATLLMFAMGTGYRVFVLSRLLKQVNDDKSDKVKVKLRLLNYPRTEAVIISVRWFFGLLIPYLIVHVKFGLHAQQWMGFVFILILSISTNAAISYFATENMLSVILDSDSMTSVAVRENSYREVGIPLRLFLTVLSVLVMPIITLGYMLFLVNAGNIKYNNFGMRIIILMILSIITLIVLIYEATNGIRKSMKMTITTLKSMARGEFSSKQISMLNRSELGTITMYINALGESMKEYIRKNAELNRQLNTLTVELTANSESLSNNTREQATSIEEIMATTEEISSASESTMGNIDDQLTAMESLIESMNRLSVVMNGVSGSVESVVQLSGEIDNTTQTSVTTLNAMLETMKVVSESSAKMSGITEIINDISDKINLLSLNASIEAARAGDAGKGFAVVAEEVSKLADMTANSIKDISTLVKSNIDEIQTGMKKIDETVMTMKNITKLVNSINTKTGDISMQMKTQHELNGLVNNEAKTIKDKSDVVKVAMSEQQNALNEIVKTIAHISEATEKTVEAAEILFKKSSEVEAMAAGLVKGSIPVMES